jgi:phage baseplate assembly protein W
MIGMDRGSGAVLDGDAHLAQSVADILTTPIGSRVMRREYGSLLFELVDRPLTAATRLLCVVAVAMALARWEPRIAVTRVEIEGDAAAGGATSIIVTGRRTDQPDPNSLTRLTVPLR